MSPDWADPTFAMARQFPAPPCVVITAGTPCQLRVGGRLVSAMPIDADSYPAGTQVKPLQLGPEWLFLPMSSKYPASYLEPLASWANKSQEALFMKYILEQSNCQKLKVYSRGRVLAVLSEYLLSVACWDGVTRSLPVDYMGKGTTGDFKAGDRCLVYDNIAQKIVIGFAGDEPRKEEGDLYPPFPPIYQETTYFNFRALAEISTSREFASEWWGYPSGSFQRFGNGGWYENYYSSWGIIQYNGSVQMQYQIKFTVRGWYWDFEVDPFEFKSIDVPCTIPLIPGPTHEEGEYYFLYWFNYPRPLTFPANQNFISDLHLTHV